MFPSTLQPRTVAKFASGFCRASLSGVVVVDLRGSAGLGLAALAILTYAGAASGQTSLEPEQAGADFPIQGEYSGKVETVTPMGAQVVALGGGTFKAVFLPGGLPGQGWNGTDRIEAAGTLTDRKASFAGGGYTASINADGATLSGKTDKGELFTFNKIFRKSPTEGAIPPADATVLFDGRGVSAWKDGTALMDRRNLFKPEGSSASSGAVTNKSFHSFTLHLEFRLPFMPSSFGQRRGNSGIYLLGRDELQVLDSFGNSLENGADTMAAKRECGAFFEYFRPAANLAFPPLSWQTYDIEYTAAKYDAAGKSVLEPAMASVWWNGALVHAGRKLVNSTLLGDPQSPSPGPQRFQAYGDSVYYRNIWIKDGVTSSIQSRPRNTGDRKTRIRQSRVGVAGAGSSADGRSISAKREPSHRVMYSKGVDHEL